MGLVVSVADLAFGLEEGIFESDEIDEETRVYEQLSDFLVRYGFPPHDEPKIVPHLPSRGELDGFPYSWIHYLKRAYAYHLDGLPLTACQVDRPADDPILRSLLNAECISHLVHHSDCEGFYVPIDYWKPLVARNEGEVPGGIVGSSYGLMREILQIAPSIGIVPIDGSISDEDVPNLLGDHEYKTERAVWFTLYENARKSIELGAAIRFG